METKERNIRVEGPQSFAIVSGKGGSGKTMIAVTMARSLAELGYRTLLIDADFATGGLSYYLTFNIFSNPRIGLADLHSSIDYKLNIDDVISEPKSSSLEGNEDLGLLRLVTTGDQRAIEPMPQQDLSLMLSAVLTAAESRFDYIIIDCRGGIDPQSVTVCELCDEILVVAETDATSIQSTQHLIDVLNGRDLRQKISGFLLNKVMDDPSSLAKASISFFRSEYLGSVPFDIDATRAYIQGKLPSSNSLFSRHVKSVMAKMLPSARSYQSIRTLSPEDFSTVTLRSPKVRMGGIVIATLSVYLTGAIILYYSGALKLYLKNDEVLQIGTSIAVIYNVMLFLSLSDSFKQGIGMLFSTYQKVFHKFLRPN